ncbi:MAG: hypothetical protein QM756_42060 [Polyangiaceae bacterium]
MPDADANQLLARADEFAHVGQGEDAASACEAAADLLLAQGNVLLAAAAYQRALHQLESLPREQKLRISERLAGALTELGMASGLSQERRVECLIRAATRFWSDKPYSARGHRALCFRCGELKAAAWMRCPACSVLPERREHLGLSQLFSEQACSLERLQEIGRRVRLGEEPVAEDVVRLFATAFYQSSAEHEGSLGRLLPGTVTALCDADSRSAVLLEVSTSADLVTEKPDCASLIDGVCMRLLEVSEPTQLDDLALADGRRVQEVRADLVRRFGSRIHFERWQRVHVGRGSVGVAWVGAGLPNSGSVRPTSVRKSGNLVAAAVALATPDLPSSHPAVHDLSTQLAAQAVRQHLQSPSRQDVTYVSQGLCVSLAGQRFAHDPSLTVEQALALLSDALGSRVRLEEVVCYGRRRLNDDDPHFPGEAAMHG